MQGCVTRAWLALRAAAGAVFDARRQPVHCALTEWAIIKGKKERRKKLDFFFITSVASIQRIIIWVHARYYSYRFGPLRLGNKKFRKANRKWRVVHGEKGSCVIFSERDKFFNEFFDVKGHKACSGLFFSQLCQKIVFISANFLQGRKT